MKRMISMTGMITLLTLPLFASVERGDQHWSNRAEGASGARASASPVDSAIAEYRAALTQNENDLEARWKLMRALRFKGAYVLESTDAKKKIFDEAKSIGTRGVEIIEAQLKSRGISRPDKADPDEIARVARSIPGAGQLYYWDAVNWGEWALVFGKMAAVRKGAAGTIRRHGEIAMAIDPGMGGGGPGRVLGRLYNQTPRVPFITGWASDEEAIKYLRQSLSMNPGDKLTTVFLAEALIDADRSNAAEARKLLREVIDTPGDPDFVVENAAAIADARTLLDRL